MWINFFRVVITATTQISSAGALLNERVNTLFFGEYGYIREKQIKTEHGSLHNYKRCIDEDEFREIVAEDAYFKAEKRGFEDGYELQDWLEAEHELSQRFFY